MSVSIENGGDDGGDEEQRWAVGSVTLTSRMVEILSEMLI